MTPTKQRRAQRRARAVDMRKAGMSYQAIAGQLDVTVTTAHALCMEGGMPKVNGMGRRVKYARFLDFGDKIHPLMREPLRMAAERGITDEQIVEDADIPAFRIRQWLSHGQVPAAEAYNNFCEACGVIVSFTHEDEL